ncbi:hypothetical protein CPB85DRAFT_1563146 [Mucidula mucida]|nr:hypothetical protein CPB85DRAFT_1563146 [Mucidula mucida]
MTSGSIYQERRANEAKKPLNNEQATPAESNTILWKGRKEESFTDEEIIQLVMCNTTPDGLAEADHPYLGRQSVIRFAEDAVVKPVYTPTEALVLAMVAEHTSSPCQMPSLTFTLNVDNAMKFGTGTALFGQDVAASVAVAINNGMTRLDGTQVYRNSVTRRRNDSVQDTALRALHRHEAEEGGPSSHRHHVDK